MSTFELPEHARMHRDVSDQQVEENVTSSDPYLSDDEEEEETPEQETPETEETEEEQETEETTTETPETEEEPEETEEPETETETTEEKSLQDRIKAYTEKYGNDPTKMAEANLFLQKLQTKQGLELGKTRQENQELQALLQSHRELIETLKSGKTKETPETTPKTADVTDDELADMFINNPAKAREIIAKQVQSDILQTIETRESERVKNEGITYNEKLIDTRAREMLLELATDLQDKSLIVKFSNSAYVPTPDEVEVISGRLNQEIAWINNNLLPDSKTFRYADDAFETAKLKLYGHDMLKKSERNGAQKVINQLKTPETGAVVLTPKGGSKTDSKLDLSKVKSAKQIRKAAEGMSNEEIEAAINASEPEYY